MTLLNTYKRYPISLSHGEGVYVYDTGGNKYLDFYGGHAVAWLGHGHKAISEAIAAQAQKLMFYSNVVHHPISEQFAQQITETLLPEKYQVYLANGGSEANEAALKIARKYTEKTHIISFKNSFHGRTMPTLGVTNMPGYDLFKPDFKTYTQLATFGDIESVKMAYDPATTAGIIIEPIQSCGGVFTADDQFFIDLRAFCDEKKIVLIFDEVQTGIGRTGTWWYGQHMGVSPDIITSAKAIGNGFPISACIIKEPIASSIGYGEHGTTYGGAPMAGAAGNAVFTALNTEQLIEQIPEKSAYLIAQLLNIKCIKKVHGKGLLLGIEIENPPENFTHKCLENRLMIGSSGRKNVFRLLPPCIINRSDIDDCVAILTKILT